MIANPGIASLANHEKSQQRRMQREVFERSNPRHETTGLKLLKVLVESHLQFNLRRGRLN